MSRPSTQPTSCSVRRTTTQVVTSGHRSRAASVLAFSGTTFPPRQAPSPVMTAVQPQSRMRSTRLSGEKPPNTTVWGAPMRAQASMATAISGTIPR